MPEKNSVSWSAMISGYVKCGDLDMVVELFDVASVKSVVAWTAMVTGTYCKCGNLEDAWKLFVEMEWKDIVTWNAMIAGYAQHGAGLVDLGVQYFDSMGKDYVQAKPDHYTCMVDLLGRAAGYVQLANDYVADGNMLRRSGDRARPELVSIRERLLELDRKMKVEGYVQDLEFALHDIGEEHKRQLLLWHSEKLAIAFGILKVLLGTRIRIFKNSRVCGDCHRATKYISAIVKGKS
ncbi:hypothetical protein ACFX2I_031912 [Malus domestica]